MEWKGHKDADHVLSWLEQAAADQYAKDKRLDPFATSMRDFDDVSPNLQDIRSGQLPNVSDPQQRITDLKSAGFVEGGGTTLSPLGTSTLAAWEKYGAANSEKKAELIRHLLLLLEARQLDNSGYAKFFEYWGELREYFDPIELIHNWDALYVLNYLDWPRNNFCPGDRYRTENTPVSDIKFDLTNFAKDVGASEQAIEGAKRIEGAIKGKIPRGRHRATFCEALEIILSNGSATKNIITHFGIPKKPKSWEHLSETQKGQIEKILYKYSIPKVEVSENVPSPNEAAQEYSNEQEETKANKQELLLPEDIDFSNVLIDVSKLKDALGLKTRSHSSYRNKKIDYVEKAADTDAVGRLGEQFALAYEQWRLRNHPELSRYIKHISKDDDSAGYDIESFELDGTPRFLEVKSTLGTMGNPFFISANEIETAQEKGKQYIILRVSNLEKNPKCCEIRFPFEDTLELTPSTFTAIFKSL